MTYLFPLQYTVCISFLTRPFSRWPLPLTNPLHSPSLTRPFFVLLPSNVQYYLFRTPGTHSPLLMYSITYSAPLGLESGLPWLILLLFEMPWLVSFLPYASSLYHVWLSLSLSPPWLYQFLYRVQYYSSLSQMTRPFSFDDALLFLLPFLHESSRSFIHRPFPLWLITFLCDSSPSSGTHRLPPWHLPFLYDSSFFLCD